MIVLDIYCHLSISDCFHYNDIIMGTMASQITSLTIVYSTVYSGVDQIKHQSSAFLALALCGEFTGDRWIPRTNGQWRGKMFPFDDVIMLWYSPLFALVWDRFCSCSGEWFAVAGSVEAIYPWGRDKMAAISQTTFSNAFSRMKMYEFRLIFHWSLFLSFGLTIFYHWFRW